MPINSKQKGARAEREFALWLRENLGADARRGQQFSGGTDSPDVVTNLSGLHFEVKHVEALNLDNAMNQAIKDAGGSVPVVAHRKNRTPWYLTFKASDLVKLCESVVKHLDKK